MVINIVLVQGNTIFVGAAAITLIRGGVRGGSIYYAYIHVLSDIYSYIYVLELSIFTHAT